MLNQEDEDIVARLANEYLDRLEGLEKATTRPTHAVFLLVRDIVDDPALAPSVIRAVARAVDRHSQELTRQDRREALVLLLARTALAKKRTVDPIRSAAAYFGTAAKRMVTVQWGEAWTEPKGDRLGRGRR